MIIQRIWPVFFLITLILLVSCSPKEIKVESETPPTQTSRTRPVEPEARGLYANAENAFANKNYDLAMRLYQQIRSRFPNGKAALYATYRLGIINYYKERYNQATADFESFVTKMPSSDLTFDATYNWAACEFQQGHYEKTYQVLSRFRLPEIQAQGPRRAETVFQLTARTAAALGNHSGAVAAYALELQLPLEEGVRVAISEKVNEHLSKINEKSLLESLQREVNEPETRQKISAKLAALAVPTPTVSTPPTGIPTPSLPSPLNAGTVSPGGTSGQIRNVGVLLPLTGKWGTYGRRALDGILLAARAFRTGEGNARLFIQDSGSSPISAASALDVLVQKREVMAVIGPLSFRESAAVAERAQQLGVLNLSLASKEGISEKGSYLFQSGLTPRVQLESLVRFCIEKKGHKRFAILAPGNNYGNDLTNQFWDLVEQMGGKVVAYQAYPSDEKDFQQYVAELAGLASLKHRKFEVGKLNDYIKEVQEKTKKAPKARLPGIIDFDALFIPDSPKAIAQIAPGLAYFDVTGISLLGTTEWNSEQFFNRGGKYVEEAIFPAGIYLGSKNPKTREFIKLYQDAYGTLPDLLATQGYEAMELIATALRSSNSPDRNRLVNQLAALRDFPTPLGNVSFSSQRVAERSLSILTLESGGVVREY